jgi:cell division protein FtsI (penicillin-binding protein 3)
MDARRVAVARILLLLPFIVLAARAAWLASDERAGARGAHQTGTSVALPPERGVITDRNGAELALSVDAPSIYVDARTLTDPRRTAAALAGPLGVGSHAIFARIAERKGFVFVKRWVSDEQARRVKALGLDGVGILPEPRRVYPNRGLAAQLIGFANIDGHGVRGIEQVEDAWLRGTARRVPVERDARGRLLASPGVERWMTAGGDVALTIDAALQADAEAALADAVKRTGARGGVVISLDPGTGDILALAEAPSFDPNRFREVDYRATRSRSFLDAADPGSTLKSFLMAAALERGAVTEDQTFDCEHGSFAVPGSVIHDSHPYDVLTVPEILQVSSNICSAKIAFALGRQAHFESLRRFGFGEVTGVGFPGESAGVLRPWKEWRPIDHATIAFGQTTPPSPSARAWASRPCSSPPAWPPWPTAASGCSRAW